MAEKRMFSKKIIDTDWFMDMPATTQNLYFHLSMRADDDGFVANPRRIIKLVGASDDDFKLLVAKKFVIPFDSGVCVITDWRVNNYLRSDRYTETIYQEEKATLIVEESGKYKLGIPSGIPLVATDNSYSNSNSISNSNIIKEDKGVGEEEKKVKHKYGEYKHILLTDEELSKLNKEFGEERTQKAITYLDEYVEMKGYKVKSHYLALKKWVFEALKEKEQKSKPVQKVVSSQYTEEDLKRYRREE